MKKLNMILVVMCGLAFAACTDNSQKEQINDESMEIEAQSEELGEDVDENDPEDLGHPNDSSKNDYEEEQ